MLGAIRSIPSALPTLLHSRPHTFLSHSAMHSALTWGCRAGFRFQSVFTLISVSVYVQYRRSSGVRAWRIAVPR